MTSTRVLMIAERFPPDIGGVARSAERTAFQLARLGVSCEVFTWTKTLPPGQLHTDVITEAGAEVIVHRFGLFGNFDFSMQHSMNVIEWLHQERPFDAVWGHYLYPSGFVAVMLAKTLQIASTVSARGNDVDRLMFPPGDFARLQWTLSSANIVTAVSHDLARKIKMLVDDVEPVVIHNTVDSKVFHPAEQNDVLRRELGIYPHETVLGFCGEMRHKKGLPFLLSTLQQVRRDRQSCLLVIGEVREREQASMHEYLADDAATRKRIIVTGHLETQAEVARHLQLCDVTLQPSVWDGLPNAVLEAMACGRLVIASDAGGIPEVIEHGVSGYLVPRAQLNRLGEATLEVLALPTAERERVARAGQERVLQTFHPEREATELSSLLARLIPKTSS